MAPSTSHHSVEHIAASLLILSLVISTAMASCDGFLLILRPQSVYTKCDVLVNIDDTKSTPNITFDKSTTPWSNATLVFLTPTGSDSLHWLKVDIPKEVVLRGISPEDSDIIKYISPKPAVHAGVYTYVYYLFSQTSNHSVTIDQAVRKRKHFNVDTFRESNKLKTLATFRFRTEHANMSPHISSSLYSLLLAVCSIYLMLKPH